MGLVVVVLLNWVVVEAENFSRALLGCPQALRTAELASEDRDVLHKVRDSMTRTTYWQRTAAKSTLAVRHQQRTAAYTFICSTT